MSVIGTTLRILLKNFYFDSSRQNIFCSDELSVLSIFNRETDIVITKTFGFNAL